MEFPISFVVWITSKTFYRTLSKSYNKKIVAGSLFQPPTHWPMHLSTSSADSTCWVIWFASSPFRKYFFALDFIWLQVVPIYGTPFCALTQFTTGNNHMRIVKTSLSLSNLLIFPHINVSAKITTMKIRSVWAFLMKWSCMWKTS